MLDNFVYNILAKLENQENKGYFKKILDFYGYNGLFQGNNGFLYESYDSFTEKMVCQSTNSLFQRNNAFSVN